ncbi:hypothetical protein [Myxosarcina sp. GI1(2024)]
MGRKAKLKRQRQQQKTSGSSSKYDSTQFVKQFKTMGYQLNTNQLSQNQADRLNSSPEIPQDKIEPQL